MKFFRYLTIASTLFVLAGCIATTWDVNYRDVVTLEQAKSWKISEIDVQVPETLTVSEANTYAPDADIVWRGDPPGNRYEQVKTIMEAAATEGSTGLQGHVPVRLAVTIYEFHAITERARQKLTVSGVHNIKFTIQVFDIKSGNALTEVDLIEANLPAFVGQQAIYAELDGQTQKIRITNHVSNVISGWLRTGPDARRTFKRFGR